MESRNYENSYLHVGFYGNGSINITNGGTVRSVSGYLGSKSGSSGTATVDGAGSLWTNSGDLYVGYAGSGKLTVINGGALSSSYVYVGGSGSGALNVAAGGSIGSSYVYLGYNSGSSGTATVDGTGSTWTSSQLSVGSSGNGTLNITGGGSVSIASNSYISSIGGNSGSSGTVTVDGPGSTWTDGSRGLYVGYSGNGTLNITNGGLVAVAGNTYVAYSSGSTGTINFGTSGGTLSTNTLYASPAQLTGTGTIITRGNADDIDLTFDGSAKCSTTFGASGTLTFDMSAASGNGDLYVGNASSHALTVKNAAVIYSGYGYLGYNGGSSGTATVNGTGSAWINNNELYVGGNGKGTLNVTAGGSLSSAYCEIGAGANSISAATIDGAGSTWNTHNTLYVGGNGKGTLNVTTGGMVSNDLNSYIGAGAASSGTATVSGSGSAWNCNGLAVGFSGNLSGTSGLIKLGGGTLSLAGNNAYNVRTTIAASGGSTSAISLGPAAQSVVLAGAAPISRPER
jgi:T5SS/PEP-CTERM-associated repeat protein